MARIKVISPDGKIGNISEEKLDKALKKGYRLYEEKSLDLPTTQTSSNGFLKTLATTPILPIAGGVIGGITGHVPGAALGGAGGEAYRQLLARQQNLQVPETSMEAAEEILGEGAIQGISEATGSVGLPLLYKGVTKTPFLGKGIKSSVAFAKKTLGDFFQLVTKIKPENAKILFKNPKALLPGEWEKAQAAWRKAAQAAGLPVDEVSPEIINALKKDAREVVFDTFERTVKGETVEASQAQIAKEALDIGLMPAAKTEKNKKLIALYSKMRHKFIEIIGKKSPELAAANRQYAIAKAGKRFRSFFPRNLDESPAYFRSSILPMATLGLGAGRGEPLEGALQAGALTALTSPLAFGTGIAATSVTLPYLRRLILSTLAEEKFNEK